MRKRVYPVPELIVGSGVRIEGVDEHSGSMDNENRLMRVPLLDTPGCRHVRAHEMAHAKYSPKKPLAPADIHAVALQRAEDMRMNVLCRRQGLDKAMDAPIIADMTIWDHLLNSPLNVATAGLSTFDTGDWKEFERRIERYPADIYMEKANIDPDDLKAFIASVYGEMQDNPTFDNTISIARKIQDFVEAPDPEPGSGSGTGEGKSDADADGEPGDGDPYDGPMAEVDLTGDRMDGMVDTMLDKEAKREAMSPYERGVDKLEQRKKLHSVSRDAEIVPAKITVQKMPKRLPPSKFKSRAKVPADMGMVPKHMNRYCTDKAIFAGRGRKRSRGGTILIDASGSMRIDESQIDAIMDEVPLGTIASYSGLHSCEGDLYVIAKNGNRAIDNLRPPGLMNLVDVPALEWMVKQDGPYYWVCDGDVTGKDRYSELPGANIFDRCMEIVEQHGIIMVPTLDELVKVIHSK